MIDEGYIKFNVILQQTTHCPVNVPPELKSIRDRLFQQKYIGYNKLLKVGYGNISIKVPEGILISATQTGHIPIINDNDFTLVTHYDIDKNTVWCRGIKKASSETMTHAALYEADSNITAIIHIHHHDLWQTYLKQLPTTSPKIPYGTPEMAYEMIRLYKENPRVKREKTIIMAGHQDGIICFGNTLQEAFDVVINL